MELGLREALRKDGLQLLEKLLQSLQESLPATELRRGEKRHADRPRQIDTIFGTIHLRRDYLYSPDTQQGRVPLDEALGLIDGSSPGLVRLVSRAAAREGYEAASDDLRVLAGIHVDGRQIHRLVGSSGPRVEAQLKQNPLDSKPPTESIPIMYIEADGTGIPMVAEELRGRKGKQADGSAKTREVKLGCVFTQTRTDEDGFPVRDYTSTTYVGGLQTAEDFGGRIREEARRRGVGRARKLVFIGDGAAWVWELARVNFPAAICILDFFHMMEYLNELCQLLYGKDSPSAQRMKTIWKEKMQTDQVAAVIQAMHQRVKDLEELPAATLESIHKKIGYLENNQQRMQYGTYRQAGLFYGSGVVEAGCRAVIGKRLKQSGMFWTQRGAENVLALRCALMGVSAHQNEPTCAHQK